ncbi:MAG: extracellular solute-binding protein [Chloroflexi bacterium]|nr:extracellular solute-binding protein [Chloroflexota bacterium]
MMRKPAYSVVLLAVLLGLIVSACAAPKAPTPAPTPAPAAASPAPAARQLTREQRLIEGAKKEGEVVIFVGSSELGELEQRFQAAYPFLKLRVYYANEFVLTTRITQENTAGRHTADVLTGPAVRNIYAAGLLTEYDFPNTTGWTGQPGHKYYRNFAASGRIVAYNTDLVSPAEVPKSWDDVKSTKWAGRTWVSTGSYDSPIYWAYLWRENDKLNWDKSFAYWEEVIRNTKAGAVTGFSAPLGRMAAGEIAFFPGVSTSGTMRLMAQGAPLGIAPLPVPASGIEIALLKNAPHPNAAQLLVDWFTSTEGLLTYVNPTMQLVLNPELQTKARGNRFLYGLGISPVVVPSELFSDENLKKSQTFWLKLLGRPG